MKLRNRTVWLIGASSGIGAELAVALAREGARLILSARREEALAEVAERLPRTAKPARIVPLDVTEDGAVAAAAAAIAADGTTVDILIYSAGDWTPTDVTAFGVERFERQIAVNYVGLVRAVGSVLPGMIAARAGDIVAVASVAGYRGLPRAEAYSSTKAAVLTFLEALRVDLAPYGVGVTAVAPGFVETPLTDGNDFPMPFMLSAPDAAERIVRGLRRGSAEIHFPRRLSLPLKLLSILPRPLYDLVAGRLRRMPGK